MKFIFVFLLLIFSITFLQVQVYGSHTGTEPSQPVIFDEDYTIEKFVTGLQYPTAMDFSENGIFVLVKNSGKIFHINLNQDKNIKLVLDLPVTSFSESGLLGIAVAEKKYVYLFFSQAEYDKWGLDENTRDVVYRYTWNGNELVNPILIKSFDGYHTRHHGGVMTADKANNVYVFKGDGDSKSIYQNYPDSNNFESGIFKIDSNNSVELYAMGVRNSFGLAIDPVTQNLWETENGEGTYDEINMIYEKFNGGWALNIGPSYRSDSEISNNLDRINDSEFQDYSYSDPKFSWYDTVGPTAIAFPNFISFEKYKDWLFVGSTNFGEIYKFQLDVERDDFIFYDTNLSKDLVLDLKDSSNEIIFATIPGIITDIKFNDDGMYVVHYSDGIIYRIYPKEFDSTKTLAIISEDKIDDKEKELIASLEGLDFFTLISQGKIIEASDSLYSFIERSYYAMLNYLFS